MQVKNKTKINVNLLVLILLIVALCISGITFAWLAFREQLSNIEGETGKIALTTTGVSSEMEKTDIHIVSGTPIVSELITLTKTTDSANCFIRVKAMLETDESLTKDEQDWLDEVNATFIEPLNEQYSTYITAASYAEDVQTWTLTVNDASKLKDRMDNSKYDIILYDTKGVKYYGRLTYADSSTNRVMVTGIPKITVKVYDAAMQGTPYKRENRSSFVWVQDYTWTQSWGGYYYLIEPVIGEATSDETLIEVSDSTIFSFCDGVQIPYEASLFYEESAISINLTFKVEVQAIQSKNLEDEGYLDGGKLKRDSAVELMNKAFNESFVETIVVKYDTAHYRVDEVESLGSPIIRPSIVRRQTDKASSDLGKFKVVLPDNPSWRSKRFEGWYTDTEFNNLFAPPKVPGAEDIEYEFTGNTTLYAKWTQLVYLRFEYMDGEETTAGALSYDGYYDETMKLPVVHKSLAGTDDAATAEEKGVTLIWFTKNKDKTSTFYLGGAKINFNPTNVGAMATMSALPREYQFDLTAETTLYGAWYFTGVLTTYGSGSDIDQMLLPYSTHMSAIASDGENNISYCGSLFNRIYIPSVAAVTGGASNPTVEVITGLKGDANGVFGEFTKVTEILYGTTVTKILENTFVKCESLLNFHIPHNIKYIAEGAIKNCKMLQTLEIGDDIDVETKTIIENKFISNCYVLAKVVLNKSIGAAKGQLFLNCFSVAVVEINNYDPTQLELDENAFAYDGLRDFGFELVVSGAYAVLNEDKEVENVYNFTPLLSSSIKLKQTIFYGHDLNGNAYKVENGAAVMSGIVEGTTMLAIPDVVNCGGYEYRVQALGYEVTFGSSSTISSISFNKHLQEIRDFAFSECSQISVVNFPDTLQSIGKSAFYHCSGIINVGFSIKAGLKFIGEKAFDSCTSLKTFIIPENIESIEDYIFLGCTNLENINYYAANNVSTSISDKAFDLVINGSSILYNYRVNVRAKYYKELIDGNLKELVDIDGLRAKLTTLFNDYSYEDGYRFQGYPDGSKEEEIQTYNNYVRLAVEEYKKIKNYVRSFETYNMSFVQNDNLLSENAVISFDNYGKTKAGVKYGDSFMFVYNGYKKGEFDSWNTEINACGTTVCEYDLFGYNYTEKTLYSISVLNTVMLSSFSFDLNADGKSYTLTGYSGTNSVFEIPNRNRESATSPYLPVTRIADNAFKNNTVPVRITFLPGIESIGVSAFEGCANLSSVTLATRLVTISSKAFYNCPALATVSIPNTVYSIGTYAFAECEMLQSIQIPSSTAEVGDYCFQNCTALRMATFANNAEISKEIGAYAFDGCISLLSAKFPVSLTFLGAYAFNGCTSLLEVDLHLSIYFEEIYEYTFNNCSMLDTVKLSDSIIKIGMYAFYGCVNLVTINMPKNLTTIGDYAYYDCKEMQVIDLSVTLLETVGISAFKNCEYAFFDFDISELVTLNKIHDSAFENCKNMRSLSLPYVTLEESGQNIFKGCEKLDTAVIRTTGIVDKTSAFENCFALTDVIIDTNDSSIAGNAFKNCYELLKIIFPSQLTTIGSYAFYECKKLTLADFSLTSLTHVYDYAFYGCTSLSSFISKTTLVEIGNYAFAECVLLSGLSFDSTYTHLNKIGNRAFTNCSSLGIVYLPKSLTSVGERIFYNVPRGAITIKVQSGVGFPYTNYAWRYNGIRNSTYGEEYHSYSLV